MGLYIYITENDRLKMRQVKDRSIQELFNEALTYDKSLMISEVIHIEKRWFRKPKEVSYYSIYHDVDANRFPYQARQQSIACGGREIICAYLYGIINGSLHSRNQQS